MIRRGETRALSTQELKRRSPADATIVEWLWRCRLLRAIDLVELGWPGSCAPSTWARGLRRLEGAGLIERVDAAGRVYQLGRRGARMLSRGGLDARYRRAPSPEAWDGLLLSGAFGAALACGLWRAGCALDWAMRPYAGHLLRPDGGGRVVRAGQVVAAVELEVDHVHEFGAALARRMDAWARALRDPASAGLPVDAPMTVLWLTVGTGVRVHTLREAWVRATDAPASFATVAAMQRTELPPRAGGPPSHWPLQVGRVDVLCAAWAGVDGRERSGAELLGVAL